MTVSDICRAIETTAPLHLQDDFDNSGLQVGRPDAPVHKVLTCLDVTEQIVAEAKALGCDMIVSHHPLLFHPLRQVSCASYQQRCVVEAILNGIAVYSAHTSLDNAPGGVNYRFATIVGLTDLSWIQPREGGGSGVIGTLSSPMSDSEFLSVLKERFGVECLRHTAPCGRSIRKVALCGGSGAFLMNNARRLGADAFVTGEFHYHDYFESKGMLLAELGHYQSECCTVELLRDILTRELPELEVVCTSLNTNATRYDSFQV
ncbi:MAG: Nif3-like dinuclear metal center hexameric protein [Bacteroidales bacterium]|nr:Nif3-like dinuclear metal center hexameric protein [Bacteroidales bacterium]